ncbi:hypothetical protein ABID29_002460 [Streptococcus rupicaprae]|uniref:Uncharacterized protein n=1 Tax=Streptococcus rupicaprae TaxID=759619 RepID=A0ABV2FL67_9STRE
MKNNLQKQCNRLYARGRIVKLFKKEEKHLFTLFIRNGAGHRHVYLNFEYDTMIHDVEIYQHIILSAHLENYDTDYCTFEQHYVADQIKEDTTELASYFNDIENHSGFAYKKSFCKLYISGMIVQTRIHPEKDWAELKIQDVEGNIIKMQYSKRMRVADKKFEAGDYIYAFATPISVDKNINDEERRFENVILEDIIIVVDREIDLFTD